MMKNNKMFFEDKNHDNSIFNHPDKAAIDDYLEAINKDIECTTSEDQIYDNNQYNEYIPSKSKEEISKEPVKIEEQEQTKPKSQSIYISYTTRLIANIIAFVITFSLSIHFLITSFSLIEEHVITYKESGDIDYKVFLKENNFYEEDYLGKDMSYISTLIDKINTTFNYNFSINQKTNMKFNYDIIGTLTIMDNTGKNTFYEKEYKLIDNKVAEMNNTDRLIIQENLDIDYSYYNNIANNFRNKYGVSTTSNFVITLNINGRSDNNKINITNNQAMSLTIPLSQREVNIKLSTDTLKNNESVEQTSSLKITNYFRLVLFVITFILVIISSIKLIKKISMVYPPKSNYDKYITKILQEYDRFIANTSIGPIVNEDDKVFELNDFQELLDVRDNLKVPINYYNIVKHQKCLFYLNKDNLIYKYYVKAIDLENKENKQ